MKEFYLSGVLNKEKSTQETIIDILKARGFLIDYVDGHFYISDNAMVDDVQYLKKSLREYSLGFIVDNEEYIIKSRRNWDKYALTRSYNYKSVKPSSIEIVIYENVSVDHAVELVTLFGVGTGDAIVRKYACQLPVRIFLDVLRVVRDLRLVACFLFFRIRTDAAVGCNTELFLFRLLYCVPDLPFGRDDHNISH